MDGPFPHSSSIRKKRGLLRGTMPKACPKHVGCNVQSKLSGPSFFPARCLRDPGEENSLNGSRFHPQRGGVGCGEAS